MAEDIIKEETAAEETPVAEEAAQTAGEAEEAVDAVDAAAQAAAQAAAAAEDKYLRLAAEYDNFRKRTAKEKEGTWTAAKAETAAAFLPVFDNLERALKQPCTDEAYAKGVEMIMAELKKIFEKLDIEMIPSLGETFDPNLHNAVMHVDDDSAEDNTIVEVFQQGFKTGEKVIRFAMVKVAN